MALLHWSPLFDALPGAAFSEKLLEASLSVLQQTMGSDMTAVDVERFGQMYAVQETFDRGASAKKTAMGRSYPAFVEARLKVLVRFIVDSNLPFIKYGVKNAVDANGRRVHKMFGKAKED